MDLAILLVEQCREPEPIDKRSTNSAAVAEAHLVQSALSALSGNQPSMHRRDEGRFVVGQPVPQVDQGLGREIGRIALEDLARAADLQSTVVLVQRGLPLWSFPTLGPVPMLAELRR